MGVRTGHMRIEGEALKLHTTIDTLRWLVNSGLIDTVEQDGICTLTEQGESKARFVLGLLRTRKLSIAQIARILAKQAPPYRIEDIHWTAVGC